MLSTTQPTPLLPRSDDYKVPQAIRSASSPSGSYPVVQRARATSLDIDAGPSSQRQSLSASPSASQLVPRSSILINARKRPYSGVIYASPALVAGSSSAAAPVVTHIPAVPSRKEREKERERLREQQRERERERDRARSKDDEKIWGIPKKALLLGLGDINFNAQMAMMAGWGHGSGGLSVLPSTAIPTTDRKRTRLHSAIDPPKSSTSSRRYARDSDTDSESGDDGDKGIKPSRRCARRSSDTAHDASSNADGVVRPASTEDPLDPEELAALNAIINTRRSMAAAQALVSGSISVPTRAHRASTSFSGSAQDLSRPLFEERRLESQDSVPSMSSVGYTPTSNGSSNMLMSPSKEFSVPLANDASSTSTTIDGADIKSPRIRFAPLPTPTSTSALLGGATDSINGSVLIEDSEESDASDMSYDSNDEDKSMKGKWYLMGMAPAYFKAEYYTRKSSKRRQGKNTGDNDDRSEDGHSLRRKSTGSISDGMSTDGARRPASENGEEERGRAGISGSKSKRKSSQTRLRSRSRTGAISSGDEDERARRRELIRLARPGGTGMVTLPDGTKIRARRVNDQPSQEEPEFSEWGFAGLAREASRRSLGGSGPPSLATTPNGSDYRGLSAYMEADEDEEDDGSGMAWVRRRRRERELKARLEREAADKAATDAAQEESVAQEDKDTSHSSPETEVSPNEGPINGIGAASSSAASVEKVSPTAAPNELDVLVLPSVTAPLAAASAAEDEAMPLTTDMAVEPVPSPSVHTVSEKAKRQSLLSAIDTSSLVSSGMFAEADAFVASPSAEEPPVASLDASMLSETSNGDSAMTSSQVLGGRANRANASEPGAPGDATPRQNTGLGLSAQKAEEIRRRHEDEVAALGAEVLAQTRRNNQRKQASFSSRGLASPLMGDDSAGEQNVIAPVKSNNRTGQGSIDSPPTMTSSAVPGRSASREHGNEKEKKSLSRAVGSIMRKSTADSEKTVRHPGPTSLKQEVIFPEMLDAKEHDKVVPQIATVNTPSVDASTARSPSPESTLSRMSSTVGGYTASTASKSTSSLHNGGSSHGPSPVSTKRIALNPSISTPTPSPWLPRRPDARGVAVVPLPSQLGVRPERPREGRVWELDDSDASEAANEDPKRTAAEEDEEEEEGSDLDAEELLEEERKTAMQKKRATTRAAGQEVVHARLGKKASARALSDLTASYDDMALISSSKASRQRNGRPTRRSSMDPRMPSGSSRSPAAPRKAPPKLVRSRRSAQSMKAAEDDAQNEEDERDLWPAASATTKSGTPRPRHILVNLPGGPGIWDSKTGGGRNAVAAINTVAAARAKAIKKAAQDRRTSFELPPGWDDEMMDYGWPRSLKGSLY